MSWRKLFFAVVFFAGGFAHELRNPVTCELVTVRAQGHAPRRRGRCRSG